MEGAGEIRLKRGRFAAELFSNINRTLLCCAAALCGPGKGLLSNSCSSPTFGVRPFTCRQRPAAGIASFWGGWHRCAATRSGAVPNDHTSKGSYAYDHDGTQPATHGRDDERRTARHLRLLARHRIRVVRLLYLRHARRPFWRQAFFSGVNPTAAFIFTLLAFAAGFAVRPFGALFFGRLGDIDRPQIHLPHHHEPDGHRHLLHRRAAVLRRRPASSRRSS